MVVVRLGMYLEGIFLFTTLHIHFLILLMAFKAFNIVKGHRYSPLYLVLTEKKKSFRDRWSLDQAVVCVPFLCLIWDSGRCQVHCQSGNQSVFSSLASSDRRDVTPKQVNERSSQ